MRLTRSGIFSLTLSFGLIWCQVSVSQENLGTKYQRCSIIQMMIEHPMYLFNKEVANAFCNIPVSDRFYNHGLGVKVAKFATQEYEDQEHSITSFIGQTNLATRTVAKWFNWDKNTGKFNMELVKERGLYNANQLERQLANFSIRGSSILSDAGENLINNTYLIMSDICYKGHYSNKEEFSKSKNEHRSFDVKITSYIFQLDWDYELLNKFYINYYAGYPHFTKNIHDYTFSYIGKVESDYAKESDQFSQSELIELVVARCLDMNLAKVAKTHPDFRIKALLTNTDPIQADIGLKEGVKAGDMYEVLEKTEDENGICSYERVGIVTPKKEMIWDNRYMADKEGTAEAKYGYTTFEVVKGKNIERGMLIREIE